MYNRVSQHNYIKLNCVTEMKNKETHTSVGYRDNSYTLVMISIFPRRESNKQDYNEIDALAIP